MLRDLDLNLLLAFDALMAERSVTRAARRLNLSQPAMSAALGRLRRALNDPLLVRSRSGMVPTPRAQSLAGPVREALATLEQALGPCGAFDPAAASRRYTLSCTDYAQLVLLPDLLRLVGAQAPGVNLRVVGPRPGGALHEDLETGRVDLAVGVFPRPIPGLHHRLLFEDHFVGLVRRDHPALRSPLTPERYAALPHLLVSPRGEGPGVVDHALERLGLDRRVALRVPTFATAPLLVARSDLVLTMAARLAHQLAPLLDLVTFTPPLPLPRLGVGLAWHARQSGDPAQVWLRARVAEAAGAPWAPEEPAGCMTIEGEE